MPKQMRLNALDMNCVGGCPGLWLHPKDRTLQYNTLGYWTYLAKVLERGLFDAIFIADIFGVYDVYGGGPEAGFRNAVEFPVNDPFLLVPAMALVTEHLGFGITGTVSYEPPYSFARRLSTLDHLTNGRMAWNIVTGYLDSAAKAFGKDRQLPHDERYELADEFMEVVYKLWEGSWREGAVVRDKERGIFADPSKIHKVHHEGKYFRMEAYHLCEPSPQRTPILFQAGSSTRGREFAAKHAECVFIGGRTPELTAATVADIRKQAAAYGRQPSDVAIFCAMTVLADETDAAAEAKLEDYRRHVSMEGALALLSGYLGIDLATADLNTPLDACDIQAIRSGIEAFKRQDPNRVWTLGDAVRRLGVAGSKPIITGSPQTCADALIHWMDVSGVDGFNIEHVVCPADFEAFVELVVPELQRRGVYKTSYVPGTFREKLFSRGRPYLPVNHPAAKYRPPLQPFE